MLLALSLLVPGSVAAADVTIPWHWQESSSSVVTGSCVLTTAYACDAGADLPILFPAAGSTLDMTLSVAAFTGAGTLRIAVYCSSTNTLLAYFDRATSVGTRLEQYAFAGNCGSVFVYAKLVSGTSATITVASSFVVYRPGAAATAAPIATGGPHPTTVPATPPPVVDGNAFGYTPECRHAERTYVTGATRCRWVAYNETTGLTGTAGSLFFDAVTSSPGRLMDDTTPDYYILAQPPAAYATLAAKLAIPSGTASVTLGMNWNWGAAPITDDATGSVVLSLEFYRAGVSQPNVLGGGLMISREVVTTGVAHLLPTAFTTGPINVPEGAVSIRWQAACLTGTICSGFYGDYEGPSRWSRLDLVVIDWNVATGSDATPVNPYCDAVTLPGYTNTCNPNYVIDPNTFAPVCGPLSGDCLKGFLAPVAVTVCNAPADGLDALGWLAYIGCLVAALPPFITNVGIMALNVIIDLLIPGATDDMLGLIRAQMETRAVISWIPQLADAWEGAVLASGVSPVGIGVVTFKDQEIDMGAIVADAMEQVAPFRDVFLALVMLGFIVKLRDRIIASLNGGSVGPSIGGSE